MKYTRFYFFFLINSTAVKIFSKKTKKIATSHLGSPQTANPHPQATINQPTKSNPPKIPPSLPLLPPHQHQHQHQHRHRHRPPLQFESNNAITLHILGNSHPQIHNHQSQKLQFLLLHNRILHQTTPTIPRNPSRSASSIIRRIPCAWRFHRPPIQQHLLRRSWNKKEITPKT